MLTRCSTGIRLALLASLAAACASPDLPGEGPAGLAPADAHPAVRRRSAPTPLEVEAGVVLAIHGGAGTIRRERMTPERDAEYRAALTAALQAGYDVLARGGSSADAVEAAIHPMEDSPLFNSGRGAVLTDDGHAELDASIMLGESGLAGAVAGARTVRHPISAARAVLESSPHVLLSGAGADRFAAERGLATEPAEWFLTPRRQEQLKRLRAEDKGAQLSSGRADGMASADAIFGDRRLGTVGCVALDQSGHLAAGTSTGGMARKAWGRIGDSPIVGAGTWANDQTCAVSCTGHGEYFIRLAIAHQMHARMAYGGETLAEAARHTVLEDLPEAGGSGGLVGLDRRGNFVAPFTTDGMYRGWVDQSGRITVRIHGDERP